MTKTSEVIDDSDQYPLSPKKWIYAKKTTPQFEDHVYGRSTHLVKVNNNKLFNDLRILYANASVEVRLGPQLDYELHPYDILIGRHDILIGPPLTADKICERASIVTIGFLPPSVQGEAVSELHKDKDPKKEFSPSKALVELVRQHMIPPDTEISYIVSELKKIEVEVGDEIQNISHMIIEQVEGLFTKIAKLMFRSHIPIKISMENRFTPEVCNELIRRWGLDPLDPGPVLKLLYTEIFIFVSEIVRERNWGKISIEGSNINLILRENAFKFPKLSEIDVNGRWVIT